MSAPFKPFSDDPAETFIFHINLPHWRQDGATYFITWRLGDSLPQEKLKQHEAARLAWIYAHGLQKIGELETLSESKQHEYRSRFTVELHRWLDAGYGSCILRQSNCSGIVESAPRHFDGEKYALDAFVIMPNHVHLLVAPQKAWPLSTLLHSWKSFTSHEIDKLLGIEGKLWQQESWNHIVRREAQLEHYRQYIAENPAKAKLRAGDFLLVRGTGITTDQSR